MGNIILFLVVFSISIFVLNAFMRRYLKIEKKKTFSYNHVNEKHKKIDLIIRFGGLVFVIITYFYVSSNPDLEGTIGAYVPFILLITSIIILELVRAFMEWKYAENKKAYILTISQLILILIFLVTFFLFIIRNMLIQ